MLRKLILYILFIFFSCQYAAQLSNSIDLMEPYVIEIDDSDSLKILKTQINGCLKKLELAKKEYSANDSIAYFNYLNLTNQRIKFLIKEINRNEGK
tara:strand:+ start:6273 stop:6560 length:288 start_codon:yes stop_codon:yes gene_type:complete